MCLVKKEEVIKENEELYSLLRENVSSNEKAFEYLLKCLEDKNLYEFYLKTLNRNFYRNKFLSEAISSEENLIGIAQKFACYLAKSHRPRDNEYANWALWFIHYSTDTEIRNYSRDLFNRFHSIIKKEHPGAVGEITGRIKSLISFLVKIFLDQGERQLNDLYAFRVVLRSHHHENSQELITTLAKIVKDFINFCSEEMGITLAKVKMEKEHFDTKEHPDIIFPNQEATNILSEFILEESDKYTYGYIKNYISNPKESGYQSIHLVIMTVFGPLEVQFRTQQMHDYAENGPASHDGYKDKPLYNFLLNLAKKANPNNDYTNFLGLTKSDLIFDRKLRHPSDLLSNIPRTVDVLNIDEVDISFIEDETTLF